MASLRLAWHGMAWTWPVLCEHPTAVEDDACLGGGLGRGTRHTLMLDIDANLKVTCIIACFVWFLAIWLFSFADGLRVMRSWRFLLILLLLLFGTPQVHSGSMGLWVNSTSKANWPGVTSCLALTWTRKSPQVHLVAYRECT